MNANERSANQRWVRRIEYALLACGLILLTFWGAARLQSTLSSRAARRFGAYDTATSIPASADSTGREKESTPALGVDFSLWDEKRIQAYKTSLAKDSDTPLAMLTITRNQPRSTGFRRDRQPDTQSRRRSDIRHGTTGRTREHGACRAPGRVLSCAQERECRRHGGTKEQEWNCLLRR